MSRSTMIIFLIGIPLLIYGYLCRLLSIYFFWDSKHWGWILIAIGVMGFLIDQRIQRTAQKKSIFLVRLGVAIMVIMFATAVSANLIIKGSAAYKNIVADIKRSGQFKSEIGDIRGFGLFLSGLSLNTIKNSLNGGPVKFIITVRGTKGHRELEIILDAITIVSMRIV